MKIRVTGKPWWVGIPLACTECGTELELDTSDTPTLNPYLGSRTIMCPICKVNEIALPKRSSVRPDPADTTIQEEHTR